jgi:S1-C subfamily serine protease
LALGLDHEDGIVIEDVNPEGPASAGLMPGDIVLSVNEIPVSEKQDAQERLADLVTMEQAKIPQLGILARTLDERLVPMFPPLRNRFGVVVAGKETYGAYQGEGPLPGDVIYSVNGMPVNSIDSLRSVLDDLKTADAIVLQVERLGSLHYLVPETDK